MSVPSPLISIRHVTKRFPGVVALDDVSLDIPAGELHAIVGENGAGKSTLMKILSGVNTDFEGEILLAGEPVHFAGTRDAEAASVSIIHQELNLVEELSVAANIFLGREIRNRFALLDQRAMEDATASLFRELQCPIQPRTRAGQLRVGDQQLVEIAKALSLRNQILIMDEPTSALTETEVERLFRVVDRLREKGVTILYISHKMDEIFRLADRITVLRDGRHVTTVDRADTSVKEVIHWMVGREIEMVELDPPEPVQDEVLTVRNLSQRWPGDVHRWRLKDIDLTVCRGEIVGIAGLMGAGRTELLECLFGASRQPYEGAIVIDGLPVHFQHPSDAQRAGVALVTEDRKRLGLFAHMTVRENISICALRMFTALGWIRRRQEEEAAHRIFQQLGIKAAGTEVSVTSLSGGNQQKTIIGRWLLTCPKVLLLDDPTRGIDVGAKAELYRLMRQLCNDGLAIVLTSSELPELLTVCDRILVLCEGRMTGAFSRHEATEQKIMEAATAQQTAS
ncbi:MAG: sugar ABC transporter ATP-binding protein [Pirellulales bacterium]